MAGYQRSNLPREYVAQLAERLLRHAAPEKPVIGLLTESGTRYSNMRLERIEGPVEDSEDEGWLSLLLTGYTKQGTPLTLGVGCASIQAIELPEGESP